ncbi:hypothetical protein GWI72_16695 [Microvirga tunisiensis]|uniref:Uncharacterized protein n=1 Tax=Pannonibacter tanglangensis TaxID=2750084 RepID=A0A7X5F556_9HYPH|nr:hypothetical protein [Pannonibacter sp. XCT-53]NBN79918.1 hypothetical protein [Pannonibacter sp. XCT-53]
MNTTINELQSAKTLQEEFSANYGHGRDFEGEAIARFAVAAGRFLGEIVGADVAQVGMAEMARKLGLECHADSDWEHAFEGAWGEAYGWPMGEVFLELNAYAHYGLVLGDHADAGTRAAQIREHLETATAFMKRLPAEAWDVDTGDAGHTLRLALGRWALDHDEAIEPYALAAFGGVSERRIRNMMSGTANSLTNDNGKVPAREALQWLADRETFRPSVWRDQDAGADEAGYPEEEELGDMLFVPVARDGSHFHPGLARDGKFTIGRPGAELTLPTFEEALAVLQQSASPAWRRPSPMGVWTNVSAVRWDRLGRAELQALADGEQP